MQDDKRFIEQVAESLSLDKFVSWLSGKLNKVSPKLLNIGFACCYGLMIAYFIFSILKMLK